MSKEAIKEEPVLWGFQNSPLAGPTRWMMLRKDIPADDQYGGALWIPLYTAPPKREWVGLTEGEVDEIIDDVIGFNSCWGPEEDFAQAIEAKLKEKNT